MGFSLFNNVAIAAAVARHKYNVPRVMIVDWVSLSRGVDITCSMSHVLPSYSCPSSSFSSTTTTTNTTTATFFFTIIIINIPLKYLD